ncbi:MAG: hypothetical protein ACR2FO_01485 [Actinomycetota bacterium]
MSDRDLQDLVITALADAKFRTSSEWLSRNLAEPARVEKFARFLARHFYYERIVHFFKYSLALASATARRPEAILASPGFHDLLSRLTLGSRDSAEQVSELVVEYVGTTQAKSRIPYIDDLLNYEQAMMIAESGPRVWRDTAEAANAAGEVFELAQGTRLLDLQYDITVVLAEILKSPAQIPMAPQTPVRLLVARSPHARVIVAHSTAAMEALLELADGQRSFPEMVETSGLDEAELRDTLEGLTEWGALRVSVGS